MTLKDWLFGRKRDRETAQRLYASIVEQARLPAFYERFGVPDSLDGRFEMISLHAFLTLHRLKEEKSRESQALSQAVFDLLFADMDRSLREMGVGDLGVGKRVKKMAEAFYGRLAAYDAALESGDASRLAAALRRNLYGTLGEVEEELPAALAAYMLDQARVLARLRGAAILSGELHFEPPR
jgi:cytochrome b pre-mRNA-processing protein 3